MAVFPDRHAHLGAMVDTQLEDRPPALPDGAPAPPGRRRWWRMAVVVLAGALLAAVLGYVVSDHLAEDHQFDRLHASVALTRRHAADVAANLAALDRAVATLRSQVASDSATWAQDTAELKAAYATLVLTQTDVSQQGTQINALHSCLGGVRQALNALAINDRASAVSSLDAVASSCAAASGG